MKVMACPASPLRGTMICFPAIFYKQHHRIRGGCSPFVRSARSDAAISPGATHHDSDVQPATTTNILLPLKKLDTHERRPLYAREIPLETIGFGCSQVFQGAETTECVGFQLL